MAAMNVVAFVWQLTGRHSQVSLWLL